jgi:hypothetical protein
MNYLCFLKEPPLLYGTNPVDHLKQEHPHSPKGCRLSLPTEVILLW